MIIRKHDGVWSKSDFSNIVEDEVILAEYTRINTLLQSELLRKGRSVMVMMGEFAPGDKLSVSEEKSDSVHLPYFRYPHSRRPDHCHTDHAA